MKQIQREKWIWLPEDRYPHSQTTSYSALAENIQRNYVVAEFLKEYAFPLKVISARIRFSADTAVQLFLNGSIIGTGPASVGGDFIGNETARDNYYASELELTPDTDRLVFFARVQMGPVQICEYSKGHGGFMLSAVFVMEDGTEQTVSTDESWLVRENRAFAAPRSFFDGDKAGDFSHTMFCAKRPAFFTTKTQFAGREIRASLIPLNSTLLGTLISPGGSATLPFT